jgi:bifunctional enzyme CysN/CysC
LITCGSVDDGKSTLIGRLLFESRRIFQDQLAAIEADSRLYGTQGDRTDFALLVDGLQAEREQGITIDVAYRFFSTAKRRFIIADTPGHEQYTRNMATGASTAALAIVLVDARKGVLVQSRRHTRIAAMMGIRHVVLAVNKMDLAGYEQQVFETIAAEYVAFAADCGITSVQPIAMSALEGDNLVARSGRMPWYAGPALLEHLDGIVVEDVPTGGAFRLPVQLVNRPSPDFRGFCGRLTGGPLLPGAAVQIVPSGVVTRIKSIVTMSGELARAVDKQSITVTLEDEVDVSRGDVIAPEIDAPASADQFEARVLWMATEALIPGRSYLLKMHAAEVRATVTAIKHRVDIDTGAALAAKTLALNDIGVVNISTSQAVAFEPYDRNRTLGGFILIDRLTFATVAAGMIGFALRRAANLHWQALDVNQDARAMALHQRPQCVWFTGLSGSGKSSIANLLEKRLHAEGRHTYLLDGDNVRHGLNRDLGFTDADRAENIRRVAEVARLMVDAGLIVLVAFISPFRAERQAARDLFGPAEFVEVFVDTPLDECERRDPKGLYAKARRGALPNLTGIDSPYEPPAAPEVHLTTANRSIEDCVSQVFGSLR